MCNEKMFKSGKNECKNVFNCTMPYRFEKYQVAGPVFAGRLQQHMRRCCRSRSYNAGEDDNDHLFRPKFRQ